VPYPSRATIAPSLSRIIRGRGTVISNTTEELSERMTLVPDPDASASSEKSKLPAAIITAVTMKVYKVHLDVEPGPVLFK
jgi:hypothetical protein